MLESKLEIAQSLKDVESSSPTKVLDRILKNEVAKYNSRIRANNNRLRMNKDYPIVYISGKGVINLLNFHNREMTGKTYKYFEDMVKELSTDIPYMYVKPTLESMFKYSYPDEQEVLQIIQENNSTNVLEGLEGLKERVESHLSNITVLVSNRPGYKIMTDANIYASSGLPIVYGDSTDDIDDGNNIFEELHIDETILEYPPEIDWKMQVSVEKDSLGTGYGFTFSKDTFDEFLMKVITISFVTKYLILTNGDKYRITKDNLKEKVKKDSNEGITLNREIKQHFKKSNTPIYYINEI